METLDIEDLPEEVLQQVFLALGHPSHLPTVALVSRKWHRVSSDRAVQRLWWWNLGPRLHWPPRHRCRSSLTCCGQGLDPEFTLFAEHQVEIEQPVPTGAYRPDGEWRPPKPLLLHATPACVYR